MEGGIGSGDWDVATNWTGDAVPTSADGACITTGEGVTVTIPSSYDAEALSLVVQIVPGPKVTAQSTTVNRISQPSRPEPGVPLGRDEPGTATCDR